MTITTDTIDRKSTREARAMDIFEGEASILSVSEALQGGVRDRILGVREGQGEVN